MRDGAAILARIEILLSDGDPDRLGVNVRPEEPATHWQPLFDEWTANLRPALAAFTLADASSEVRDVGRQLGVAVSNSLTATAWFLRDLTRPTAGIDTEATRQRAKGDHADAVALVARLMALIRDPSGGNKVATREAETPREEELLSGGDSAQ